MPFLRQSPPAFPAILFVYFVSFVVSPPAPAEEPQEPPRVLVVAPLGVTAGEAATVTIRGLRLDEASEVRFGESEPPVRAEIKSKGQAEVPGQQDARQVGDTQIEVELTLPVDTAAGTVEFIVVTPPGQSEPHRLLVAAPSTLTAEKEPNDGFRQAQPVELPATVQGSVERGQDVDVFRFEGQAGQTVRVEVLAARYGSALDPILTLFDAQGRIAAYADGTAARPDPVLEATLPHAGPWYVSLIDAHDRGGPAHVYQLRFEPRE